MTTPNLQAAQARYDELMRTLRGIDDANDKVKAPLIAEVLSLKDILDAAGSQRG